MESVDDRQNGELRRRSLKGSQWEEEGEMIRVEGEGVERTKVRMRDVYGILYDFIYEFLNTALHRHIFYF